MYIIFCQYVIFKIFRMLFVLLYDYYIRLMNYVRLYKKSSVL